MKGDIVKKKRAKGKTMLVSDLWNGTYSHQVSETYYKAKGLDLREVEIANVRNDCHMKPKKFKTELKGATESKNLSPLRSQKRAKTEEAPPRSPSPMYF